MQELEIEDEEEAEMPLVPTLQVRSITPAITTMAKDAREKAHKRKKSEEMPLSCRDQTWRL